MALAKARTSPERQLDCFYTTPEVARLCMSFLGKSVDTKVHDLWVEPSAGNGVFFDLLPKSKIGLDIERSENPKIKQSDFFQWIPPADKNIIVVGNPPFGKNSSLAVRFFNHASMFAQRIAMIFPRTFEKESTVNRLEQSFHLDEQLVLEPDSFIFRNEAYSVPCVFQIWTRRQTLRAKIVSPKTHSDFNFVSPHDADFALQRVGVNAGRVKEDVWSVSPQSHYFIKSNTKNVIDTLRNIDWSNVKHRTAGNPSISKSELVANYLQNMKANGQEPTTRQDP